jgi:hypothetical protein
MTLDWISLLCYSFAELCLFLFYMKTHVYDANNEIKHKSLNVVQWVYIKS